METRMKRLTTELAGMNARIVGWKSELAVHRGAADRALVTRKHEPAKLMAAEAATKLIAKELDKFWSLIDGALSVPGIREGQVNGLAIALRRLLDESRLIVDDLRSVRDNTAA